jgi:hypothetical protein
MRCGLDTERTTIIKGDLMSEHDPVNHPKHYTSHPSGVECIQITEHMGFNLGNALKYVWRADLKDDAIEDMEKAVWYLQREIAKRKAAGKPHPGYQENGVVKGAALVPEGEGWITWGGGKCPLPPTTDINVRFRDGGRWSGVTASRVVWEHKFGSRDVIAYRVIK